ncbi:small heat shock protein, putative [Hepatocystis sp. ex Piliocolobus tephrosceles]|nr:small heat shock protein, putative [Hepatocystis sp. ex Piliocolobus tephrosceles]
MEKESDIQIKKEGETQSPHQDNLAYDSFYDDLSDPFRSSYFSSFPTAFPFRKPFFDNDFYKMRKLFNSDMRRMRNFFDDDFYKRNKTEHLPGKYDLALRNDYTSLPLMDVKEKENEYEIKLDIPGVNKENVQINLCNGRLEVSAKILKDDTKTDEKHKYYLKERIESSFFRSFTLPDSALEDNIKATFKDGVLKIDIPKKEEVEKKKKKIEIQ